MYTDKVYNAMMRTAVSSVTESEEESEDSEGGEEQCTIFIYCLLVLFGGSFK